MIIHNKTWLNNQLLHEQFEQDYHAGCLKNEELGILKQKYPVGFYSPGFFVQIGLFILTCIIVSCSTGFISLFLANASIIDSFSWPLLLGIVMYVILERMVKERHYYHAGVDNALLWMSASSVTGGFIWMLDTFNSHSAPLITISVFIFTLGLYLTLRFADVLVSAVTSLAALAFIFFTWNSVGKLGLTTMPFMMMLASAGIYLAAVKLFISQKAAYYRSCLSVVQVLSLLTLYFSGNYFVVQVLSNEMTGAAPGTPVPFGFIFWIWTFAIPFVYIGWGLKKKDTILVRSGLLLIAGAIFTFRYYYHVLPIELALTIGGCVLLALSYAVIKYLKTPKHGLTYAEHNRNNLLDKLNVESIIIGETFSQMPAGPTGPQSPFGGGSAGGGGSSGNF